MAKTKPVKKTNARTFARKSIITGPDARQAGNSVFQIVGIGASAGALEVFEKFFRHVPPEIGLAFVLVPHLDSGHASILTEILQRATVMPVVEVDDGHWVLLAMDDCGAG